MSHHMDGRRQSPSTEWGQPAVRDGVAGAALIEKACRVLDIAGSASGPVTVARLLAETGWPRATLHRIVAALASQGFLRHDPIGAGYRLGFRFMELAQNTWAEQDLVAIASMELRRLRDMTGETAYLAVPAGGAMVGLGKFEGAHGVRSAARLGIRKPMHCTSQGKAILAFLPEAALREQLGRSELEAFTPRTITDPERLRAQLAIVRQRGYAVEDEEIVAGNRCVGAPVLDAAGRAVAAISVAGPVWRLTAERAERLGPEIVAVARSIGAQLAMRGGGRSPEPGAPFAHPGCEHAAFHGADPHWDGDRGVLTWVDRLGPTLFETRARGTAAHALPREEPIHACCSLDGTTRLWQAGSEIDFCDRAFGPAEARSPPPLAAARHPSGSLWTASEHDSGCAVGATTAGDGPSWIVSGRITALAWSPDGLCAYAADAARGVIYRLDPSSRSPKVFSRLPSVSGEPRGIAVDTTGRLWAALYEGWSVVRFSNDGDIERSVALPVPRPTGLAFGTGGREIFVTTARVGLSRDVLDNAPLSGRVLQLPLETAPNP
ncbi:IclR family transcriptional regulator [Aureimonas flava]|uniref:IclR family transcriptional regulator n=1 Tax=Aureimonas flava TaxID=2320271 RepID=A0A3A1WLX1_9HYPH|nr:IclR family transcriptional regulator C-terminal domain-containing protein [Aureimonas flava]RIY01388.1 IclR family transcriptional regulator [Aureimonas flava]